MKIIIFGSSGMLGRYVSRYLSSTGFEVIKLTRVEYELARITLDSLKLFLFKHNISNADVVVNCAGVIPQSKNGTNRLYYTINSIFPVMLSAVCNEIGCKMIHITTDCVFDGKSGNYTELDTPNPVDDYGTSKLLGELCNSTIIRTSIIGEELCNKASLLEWVKSNNDKKINGYINHFWNGVTCLQLAKIIEHIIKYNLYWNGVRHIFSLNKVSKYELISMINDIYELNITINKLETEKVDRSLTSVYEQFYVVQELREQIIEQKLFKPLEVAFLIISCSNDNFDTLNTCIGSIRKFYNEIPICIIDNSAPRNTIKGYNIRHYSNPTNSWELGAIWKGYEIFAEIDRFIVMHDSTMLINKVPINIYNSETTFVPFWMTLAIDYSPLVPWVEKKMEEIGIKLEYDDSWYSVSGCMCVIDRTLIKKLFELKANVIVAIYKQEAVGTEILFGYLMKYILGKNIKALHDSTFNDCFIGKQTSMWIKKFRSGQSTRNGQRSGVSHDGFKIEPNIYVTDTSLFHPNYLREYKLDGVNYHSVKNGIDTCEKNQWYKHYLVRFDEYPEDAKLLISTFPSRLEIIPRNDCLSGLLNSVRHQMFSKKYFRNSYNKLLDDVINDRLQIV